MGETLGLIPTKKKEKEVFIVTFIEFSRKGQIQERYIKLCLSALKILILKLWMFIVYVFCPCVYASVCVCVYMHIKQGGQKRILDPPRAGVMGNSKKHNMSAGK